MSMYKRGDGFILDFAKRTKANLDDLNPKK